VGDWKLMAAYGFPGSLKGKYFIIGRLMYVFINCCHSKLIIFNHRNWSSRFLVCVVTYVVQKSDNSVIHSRIDQDLNFRFQPEKLGLLLYFSQLALFYRVGFAEINFPLVYLTCAFRFVKLYVNMMTQDVRVIMQDKQVL
jgi:hypothetical protein